MNLLVWCIIRRRRDCLAYLVKENEIIPMIEDSWRRIIMKVSYLFFQLWLIVIPHEYLTALALKRPRSSFGVDYSPIQIAVEVKYVSTLKRFLSLRAETRVGEEIFGDLL